MPVSMREDAPSRSIVANLPLRCKPHVARSLTLVPAAVLFVWGQLRLAGYIKDDAFISLRYAARVAEGSGLVFNGGTEPLEGYSNFLWVLLAVPVHWLDVDASVFIRGLSCLAAMSTVVYTWLLATQLAGEQPGRARWWTGFFAATGLAAHPMLALWGQGGLEAPLVATAFAAATYHASRVPAAGSASRDLAYTVMWCLIALLTRPEGLFLTAAVGLYLWTCRTTARPEREPTGEARWLPIVVAGVAALAAVLALGPVATSPSPLAPGPILLWHELALALPIAAIAGLTVAACAHLLSRTVDRLASRRPRHHALLFAAATGTVLAVYHGWRVAYFGDLWPNPSYVKTAGGLDLVVPGLLDLLSVLGLAGTGALVVGSATALALAEQRPQRVLCFGLIAIMTLYFVVVGGDEMQLNRLWLPALPLVLALAATGLVGWLYRLRPRVVFQLVAILGPLLILAALGLRTVEAQAPGSRVVRAKLKQAQESMALRVAASSPPGTVVVFQDMGAAPYAATDLRWIDPIGLVDRRVAHARADVGANPFREIPDPVASMQQYAEFRAEMRDYLFGLSPEWIVGVAYLNDGGERQALDRAYGGSPRLGEDAGPLLDLLLPALKRNAHYHRLFSDQRLAESYRIDGVWQREPVYYIVLFKRRDTTQPRSLPREPR